MKSAEDKRKEFVLQKKNERERREEARIVEKASDIIQRTYRRYKIKKGFFQELLLSWETVQKEIETQLNTKKTSTNSSSVSNSNSSLSSTLTSNVAVVEKGQFTFRLTDHIKTCLFLSKYSQNLNQDFSRVCSLAKVILSSWAKASPEENYSAEFLLYGTKRSQEAQSSIQRLMLVCLQKISEMKDISLGPQLRLLITLPETKTWIFYTSRFSNDVIKKSITFLCDSMKRFLVDNGYLSLIGQTLSNHLVPSKEENEKTFHLWVTSWTSISFFIFENFCPPSDENNILFVLHILSIPLLIPRLSQQLINQFLRLKVLERCLTTISTHPQQRKIIFNSLEGNKTLFLIGNITELARHTLDFENSLKKPEDLDISSESLNTTLQLEAESKTSEKLKKDLNDEKTQQHLDSKKGTLRSLKQLFSSISLNSKPGDPNSNPLQIFQKNSTTQKETFTKLQEKTNHPWLPSFTTCLTSFFSHCQKYVSQKSTNFVSYHPIFQWYSGSTEPVFNLLFPKLISQLELLWSQKFLNALFGVMISQFSEANDRSTKIIYDPLFSLHVQDACDLYLTISEALLCHRSEISNKISYFPMFVPALWRFMNHLGPKGNMEIFLTAASNPEKEPLISILKVFCETCYNLLLIVDGEELYEKQTPFKLQELALLSKFLNTFVFTMLWENVGGSGLLDSSKKLLRILYERNSMKSFTPENHWLIEQANDRDFQRIVLQNSLSNQKQEQERSRAFRILTNIPHCVLFKTRLKFFQSTLENERLKHKEEKPIVVTIRRNHLIEDGLNRLSSLKPMDYRKIIRIRFVNELGLDEAGIDQMGVFKEFLEETLKQLLGPTFGLFKSTPLGFIYPSPSSEIHENYLELFAFAGKLLGKAVFEGITLDVPFPHFFLSKLLGSSQQHIDQLPSLDEDLYKNLLFLKRYEGNFDDLYLSFVIDDERFGEIRQVELKPGGKAIQVTQENVILYTYLMADYKLNREIYQHSKAFINAFRSILNLGSNDSLSVLGLQLFSPSELQTLISGNGDDFDVDDLKKNTSYEGGYHFAHKVIRWFWEVVSDFSPAEKRALLKYATSCSRPPISGFSKLEPRFTIRCVQENESNELETPIGLLTSFLNLGNDVERLPTASTCFNLLKLPSYKKKSTLAAKLKYAINSGAGFELS